MKKRDPLDGLEQELHDHINEFGTSIMRAPESKESKEGEGSVATRLKVTKILASIQGGNKEQLRRLLEIPKVDEKDVGLEELSAMLVRANKAIADLGAITPEIAARFESAAVTTGRVATAKGLTGMAIGVGIGAVPVPGVSHAFSAAKAIRTVNSTIKHIRRLQKIQLMAKTAGNDDLVDMLDYIIAKKQSKKIKSGVGGIPFASAVSTVGFKMKGAWKMAKGTRGKGRESAAADLIGAAQSGGPSAAGAQLSIMELVDDLEEYKQVMLGGPAGSAILVRKMASA